MGKEVVLHTHFNAPEEITWITEKAMRMLFERGIFTRNQSVLIRGVNDTRERMQLLVKRLGHLNVHAYYVYMHDMVQRRRRSAHDHSQRDRHREVRARQHGRLQHADVRLRRAGRRRQARRALVRVLRSRKRHRGLRRAEREAGQAFVYFDPIDKLSPDAQARWAVREIQDQMIAEAVRKAGVGDEQLVLA